MTGVYHSQLATYSCTTLRVPESLMWQPRPGSKLEVRVLEDCSGYFCTMAMPDESLLVVHEVVGAEIALLSTLSSEARSRSLSRKQIKLPPAKRISSAATRLGASATVIAAASGMAAITDWKAVLPEGYACDDRGLCDKGEPVVRQPRLNS